LSDYVLIGVMNGWEGWCVWGGLMVVKGGEGHCGEVWFGRLQISGNWGEWWGGWGGMEGEGGRRRGIEGGDL